MELVEDALKGPSYAADLAGMTFAISFTADALYLRVYGYNDRLLTLLDMVLTTMHQVEINEERFAVVVEKVLDPRQPQTSCLTDSFRSRGPMIMLI